MKRYLVGIVGCKKPFYSTDEVVLAADMLDMLKENGYHKAYLLPTDGRLVPFFTEDDYQQYARDQKYGDLLAAFGSC